MAQKDSKKKGESITDRGLTHRHITLRFNVPHLLLSNYIKTKGQVQH